jgi:hypothetical protein
MAATTDAERRCGDAYDAVPREQPDDGRVFVSACRRVLNDGRHHVRDLFGFRMEAVENLEHPGEQLDMPSLL